MKVALRSLFVLAVGLLSNPVSNGLPAVEASAGRGQGQRLLVRFKEGAAPERIVSANRAANATVLKTFEFVKNLQVVSVPDGADLNKCLAMFRADETVLYAEPDHRRFAETVPNDPMFSDLWGLDNQGRDGGTVDADIDAPEGWEITQGSDDVVVAVIDTGIDYNHEDLAANMWANEADCNNNGVDDDGNGYIDDCHGIDSINGSGYPMDTTDCQHGTHVAGTIGAIGNNGKGVVGVNWHTRLMALRFLS